MTWQPESAPSVFAAGRICARALPLALYLVLACGTASAQDPTAVHIVAGGAGTTVMAVAVLGVVVVIGFVALAAIMARGFRELARTQSEQIAAYLRRDDKMREREKFVLAAMIESELNANKVKLEAFLVVYDEMLKALREQNKDTKMRQTGEIVHEQPHLSRIIFDSNLARMDILEPQLAADIAALYAGINPDPGYVTLEANTPLQDTVYQVEKVIAGAHDLMAPIERILSALQIILRDKRGAAMAPLSPAKPPAGTTRVRKR